MSLLVGRKEEQSYQDGLDQVLSNTEFETTQQDQQIQVELDKIKAHEKEIEEKEKEMEEFARATADMENRREKALKQSQLNRDNISSLRHTASLLDEHIEALNSQYQSMAQKNRDTQAQYTSAVKKYTEKWERFHTTYTSTARARELSVKRQTLDLIKAEEVALDAEMADVKSAITAMRPESWAATVQLVLKIATIRVETEAIYHLVQTTRQASHSTKQELQTARNKLKLSPSNTEEERMAVETESEREERGNEGTSDSDGVSSSPSMDISSDYATADHTHEASLSVQPTVSPIVTTAQRNTSQNAISGGLTHGEASEESNEPIGQGQGSGVFVRPQCPPRRFTTHLVSSQQQLATTSVSSADTLPQAATPPTQETGRAPRVIPPVFHLQSPKPPIPNSPRLHTVPSSPVSSPRTLQIPKFSLPFSSGKFTSSTPTLPQQSPQATSGAKCLPTASTTLEQPEKTMPPITNKGSSYAQVKRAPSAGSSDATVPSRFQYQLLMPPKPSPLSARPTAPSRMVPETPPQHPTAKIRTFSLTHTRHDGTAGAKATTEQHQKQVNIPSHSGQSSAGQISAANTTNSVTGEKPTSSRQTSPDYESNHSSFAVSEPPIQSTGSQTREKQNEKVPGLGEHYSTQARMMTVSGVREGLVGQKHDQCEVEEMEVVGNDSVRVGGGGDGECDTSFNLTGTSVDFGEQSTDFEANTSGLFSLQQDDGNMFTMSQTGSFFNTDQSEPSGYFNFMTTNEGSTPISDGDFFSHFGKGDTPETGGSFLF